MEGFLYSPLATPYSLCYVPAFTCATASAISSSILVRISLLGEVDALGADVAQHLVEHVAVTAPRTPAATTSLA